MSVDREEAQRVLDTILPGIRRCTDVLLHRQSDRDEWSLASCVHVQNPIGRVALTAEHVTRPNHLYYCAPKRLPQPKIPREEKYTTPPIPLVAKDKTTDLALFDTSKVDLATAERAPYDLTRSENVDIESVRRNIGSLSLTCGTWGKQSVLYGQGPMLGELPLYVGIGPIRGVRDEQIVCDHAEKDVLELNTSAYPDLAKVTPTGGARDLSGISGSGLWVKCAAGPTLIGIVLGRLDGRKDEHLIRATPIWVVRDWLEQLSSGTS